jgi:hypothetical protein
VQQRNVFLLAHIIIRIIIIIIFLLFFGREKTLSFAASCDAFIAGGDSKSSKQQARK